jgi:hypothetical protein
MPLPLSEMLSALKKVLDVPIRRHLVEGFIFFAVLV